MTEHDNTLQLATGGLSEPAEDWMPASQVRALVYEDPLLVWLDHHGEAMGFEQDQSDYAFADFIFEKGNQFESKWVSEMASEAVPVCAIASDVRRSEMVRKT